jgi:predicted acyl esterase
VALFSHQQFCAFLSLHLSGCTQTRYLDARTRTLQDSPVVQCSEARYEPLGSDGGMSFDYRFASTTELTGHMKLRLWVEAVDADDMDLFVAIQKLDRDGQLIPFVFYSLNVNGPAALGWLRVSHRELDERRSRPEQPVHSHLREQRLSPGEPVPVDIEIWPSSTRFLEGQSLRVRIQGRDIQQDSAPNAPFARHENTRNGGTHIIHTGGAYDAYLLVPEIPPLTTELPDTGGS